MADKLKWCFGKKEVKLIEPNENLAKSYLDSSEETLLILRNIAGKSNMWLATTKYYCEYFASYAILMKIGIKSEIHDCTIEIIKFLEKEGIISFNLSEILKKDKELRIENQYYLKNKKVHINYEELRNLVLKIKDLVNKITNEEVEEIRKKISRWIL